MSTIGVAIAIPEPWASQLQAYRSGIGDTTAEQIPTHITLVPPTMLTDRQAAEAHLAEVAEGFASFEIHLRGTGTFRPTSPVVFVSVVQGISFCEQLADACRRGPLASTPDFPYHPHVTVAHHLDDDTMDRAFDELADFDCTFETTEFHLYAHDELIGWQPDRTFSLQPRTS